MDRAVFMTFNDFSNVVNQLKDDADLSLYRSQNYESPFVEVSEVRVDEYDLYNDSRFLALMIGSRADGERILGKGQRELTRSDRKGFVDIRYGGDDEEALGASTFAGDPSETEKAVSSCLARILKKQAHKGVKFADGTVSKIPDSYFWTDAALQSGKNWHYFLGYGVRKIQNKEAGLLPK
ncbi:MULTISPECIES: hypothetical protein [Pseudomonas]|jgi:hypothetical protein|uniref:Uncharacterized protein n=1 Tax=Pseudomonas frederiksbergensis TaxID=104087 RepID=A0A6L5BXD4_9PSED|nr:MULTISPECIES: hypothetical protein [Pseudomonas]KAF2393249.1 hypothetical protein FX983_01212 [Pseudomonas frederiksbergensis]MDN3224723.1 hypothetical protein [Pseudomonas nunensis]UZE13324.1 hypothetical protein LOY68_06855 [Pseudomonas sp. B21-053]